MCFVSLDKARSTVVGSLSGGRRLGQGTCRPWISDSASLEESGGYLGLQAGEEQHFSRRRAGNVRLKCRGDLAPDKAILLADHVTWPRTRRRARPGRLCLEPLHDATDIAAARRPSVYYHLQQFVGTLLKTINGYSTLRLRDHWIIII